MRNPFAKRIPTATCPVCDSQVTRLVRILWSWDRHGAFHAGGDVQCIRGHYFSVVNGKSIQTAKPALPKDSEVTDETRKERIQRQARNHSLMDSDLVSME